METTAKKATEASEKPKRAVRKTKVAAKKATEASEKTKKAVKKTKVAASKKTKVAASKKTKVAVEKTKEVVEKAKEAEAEMTKAGVKLMKDAIEQVLSDATFQTGREEAAQARSCASDLSSWIDDKSNQETFEKFSTKLYKDLSALLVEKSTSSANRETIWRDFFLLRSSDAFIKQWKDFLQSASVPVIPTCFQYITDTVFRTVMKIQYSQSCTDPAKSPISPTEASALRYAAGYVCRNISGKLKRSKNNSENQEMLACISYLVRGKIDDEEREDSEKWTMLVDRGGLWKVRNTFFKVFCALEEEIRLSLHKLVSQPRVKFKEILVTQLVASKDVNFYWSIAAAEFETEDTEIHKQLLQHVVELFVTVRGFAFASSWVEKYKCSSKKSTQRSKGLRGKLYTENAD